MTINNAALRWGHRYVMGRVNAYCQKCTDGDPHGRVHLTCKYDDEED